MSEKESVEEWQAYIEEAVAFTSGRDDLIGYLRAAIWARRTLASSAKEGPRQHTTMEAGGEEKTEHKHHGHAEGDWRYYCCACSGLFDPGCGACRNEDSAGGGQ